MKVEVPQDLLVDLWWFLSHGRHVDEFDELYINELARKVHAVIVWEEA